MLRSTAYADDRIGAIGIGKETSDFMRAYSTILALVVAVHFSAVAAADSTEARCDIYPKGDDHTDVIIACTFSQRQGNATSGEVEATLEGDTWMVVIDGLERYEVPLALIECG